MQNFRLTDLPFRVTEAVCNRSELPLVVRVMTAFAFLLSYEFYVLKTEKAKFYLPKVLVQNYKNLLSVLMKQVEPKFYMALETTSPN